MNTIFNDNNKKILEIKDSEFIERAAIGSGQVLFSNVISKVLQFIKIYTSSSLSTCRKAGLRMQRLPRGITARGAKREYLQFYR